MKLAVHTLRYAALAVLLTSGFAYGAAHPHTDPAPPRTFHIRRATPEEALIHQLEQAFEMDRITAGQR